MPPWRLTTSLCLQSSFPTTLCPSWANVLILLTKSHPLQSLSLRVKFLSSQPFQESLERVPPALPAPTPHKTRASMQVAGSLGCRPGLGLIVSWNGALNTPTEKAIESTSKANSDKISGHKQHLQKPGHELQQLLPKPLNLLWNHPSGSSCLSTQGLFLTRTRIRQR